MADFEPAFRIPTPVGGTPLREDGAPSVLIAVLYAMLIPFAIYRLARTQSRLLLLIGTITLSIEHVVIWSLRASQAFGSPERRASAGLLVYTQLSFGGAYIALANDTVPLLRVLLVRATCPPDSVGDPPYATAAGVPAPRTRFWTRRAVDFLRLFFIPATVTNIVAGFTFKSALHTQASGDRVMRLRYASAGVATLLISVLLVWMIVARVRVPRINTAGADRLIVLFTLLLSIGLYRLGVMHFHTPGLLSADGWASQESHGAKALFYVFHALPEWASAALLLVPNTRGVFGAGIFGDWRANDGDKSCVEVRKERKEKRERARRREDGVEMA